MKWCEGKDLKFWNFISMITLPGKRKTAIKRNAGRQERTQKTRCWYNVILDRPPISNLKMRGQQEGEEHKSCPQFSSNYVFHTLLFRCSSAFFPRHSFIPCSISTAHSVAKSNGSAALSGPPHGRGDFLDSKLYGCRKPMRVCRHVWVRRGCALLNLKFGIGEIM